MVNKFSSRRSNIMMLPAAAVLFISCCTIINTSQSFSPPIIISKRISFHTANDEPGGRRISPPLPSAGGILPLMMSNVEYPEASDGEALQALFSKFCNGEGLMTEDVLRNVPSIKDMLVSIYTYIYFQWFMHTLMTFVSASHIYHILQFRNKVIYYHQNFQKYGQLHLNFLKL